MYNAALTWLPVRHDDHGHQHFRHIDQSWRIVMELNGEWRDKTAIDGDDERNTGGNVIFATAGLRWENWQVVHTNCTCNPDCR